LSSESVLTVLRKEQKRWEKSRKSRNGGKRAETAERGERGLWAKGRGREEKNVKRRARTLRRPRGLF